MKSSVAKLLKQAVSYRRNHKLDLALENLEAILDHDPNNIPAQTELGKVCILRGDLVQARVHFKRVLRQAPSDPWAHRGLGVVYRERGDFTRAKAHFNQVLTTNPDDPGALQEMGLTHLKEKFIQKAMEYFHKAAGLTQPTELLEDQVEGMVSQLTIMVAAEATVAGLAHEINSPLSTIQLTLANLDADLQRGGLDLDTIRTDLAEVKSNANKINELIEHFRSFVRKGPISQKALKLHDLVSKSLNLFARQLKHRHIQVEIDSLSKSDAVIWGNRVELEQVFANLFANSRDALETCETKFIRVTAANPTQNVMEIRFSDTGKGIPKTIRPHIFDFLYSNKGDKGNGLGLWLCDHILRKHGGSIELNGDYKEGTQFIISLPLFPRMDK